MSADDATDRAMKVALQAMEADGFQVTRGHFDERDARRIVRALDDAGLLAHDREDQS